MRDDDVGNPQALPEARWVTAVFFVYFLWDLLHDVFHEKQHFLISCAASGIALVSTILLCIVTYIGEYAGPSSPLFAVLFADFSLLAIVLGFRELKGLEEPIARKLGKSSRAPEMIPKEWPKWTRYCAIGYGLGLAGVIVGWSA